MKKNVLNYKNFILDFPTISLYEKSVFKQDGYTWISIKILNIPIYTYMEMPIYSND